MRKLVLGIVAACISSSVFASDVEILSVLFEKQPHSWTVRTTLRHDDTGWEHYADAWRIMTENRVELGQRILAHPHVTEQPFARSLSDVKIPGDVKIVFIEAHDTVSGWSSDRVRVDLSQSDGVRFRVKRQ